jgi:hypothetical protein
LTRDWRDIWTEQELKDEYGLTEQHLTSLRKRGLPCIRVNTRTRLYERETTVAFLIGLLDAEKE